MNLFIMFIVYFILFLSLTGGGGGLGLNLGSTEFGGGPRGGSPTPRVTFADEPPQM